MTPHGGAWRAARALVPVLDIILPRACLLCGARIAPGTHPSIPLCVTCAGSLRRIGDPRCPRCGKPLISEKGMCMRCRTGDAVGFDSAIPLFRYKGPAGALVRAYKSGGRRSLARFWADLAGNELSARWPDRAVVPVPPRPEKIRRGGWDHVEAVAAALESGGVPVRRLLTRTSSVQQKSLDKAARRANSKSSYFLKDGADVPRRVVLIDDVFTTGATVDACAAALKRGGAEEVGVLVFAAD